MGKFYVLDKRLSFQTGPQFGFLLNAREKIKALTVLPAKADIDGAKNFDVSWGVGVLVPHFRSAGRDVPLQHRPDAKFGIPMDNTPKNGVIQIGVGYPSLTVRDLI